jgi:hypothetical protein
MSMLVFSMTGGSDMRKLRIVTESDLGDIENALGRLYSARNILTRVKAIKSADKVRKAIKSAEGAYRHALRCANSR